MKQEIFSKYVFEFLEGSFPEFITTIKYHKDGSFDCSLRNPSGEFSIWIATCNEEITIGIAAPDGKTDIHTHISCYEIDDLHDCFKQLTVLINDIKDNKVIVYVNNQNVYAWIDYHRLIEKETKNGTNFQKYFWSGRP
ncbi:hypothetical protein [uncultured Chitinophaga sp.]|jgi:hypothetical protein|uniref:hypothetical protein n=1 Tax=uncultured Chitinophaga sp. TaxID=339340 RepID=UPI0026263E30|nr:hypothetical protein [uncultured Chitinophaga sp.]